MADRNFERALRSAARRGRTAGVCPDAAIARGVRGSESVDGGARGGRGACRRLHGVHRAAGARRRARRSRGVARRRRPASMSARSIRRWGWLVPAMTAVLVVAVWCDRPISAAAVASNADGAAHRGVGTRRTASRAGPDRVARRTPADARGAAGEARRCRPRRDARKTRQGLRRRGAGLDGD